jgi:GAF domain-containing protein
MLEELQVIADSLAARLRRSVAIDDQQLQLLVHTPHGSETVDQHRVESVMQKIAGPAVVDWVLSHGIATAAAPVRIPPNEHLKAIARICVPVRCRGILLAYLWLLDAEQSIIDTELEQAVASANAAGEVLFRERLLCDLKRSRDRELLRDLLAPDETVRVDAARALVAGDRLPEGAQVGVLAVGIRHADEADPGTRSDAAIELAFQRSAHRLAPLRSIWTTCGGSNAVVLVAGARGLTVARLRMIAWDLRTQIRTAMGEHGSVHIGVGPVVSSIELTHDSHSCAEDAVRVIAQVPEFNEVATWYDLGFYRLISQLPLEQLRHTILPAGLRHLLDFDDAGVLLGTAEVYLDEAGRVPATIERLRIHRTSLYYRLNRIEEITGMSMNSGGDRLTLHLGIKLARLLGRFSVRTCI